MTRPSLHRVVVDTLEYRLSHRGASPRGRGSWSFRLQHAHTSADEVAFSWGGTYSACRDRAVAEARRLGVRYVVVDA